MSTSFSINFDHQRPPLPSSVVLLAQYLSPALTHSPTSSLPPSSMPTPSRIPTRRPLACPWVLLAWRSNLNRQYQLQHLRQQLGQNLNSSSSPPRSASHRPRPPPLSVTRTRSTIRTFRKLSLLVPARWVVATLLDRSAPWWSGVQELQGHRLAWEPPRQHLLSKRPLVVPQHQQTMVTTEMRPTTVEEPSLSLVSRRNLVR